MASIETGDSARRRNHRGHFVKRAIPLAVRREIAERHGGERGKTIPAACGRCGAEGAITWWPNGWVYFTDLEMDHVKPEFLGGESTATNLALLCRRCNRSKGWRNA